MRMKHTALLTGCYDWDAELLPPEEFEARLEVIRRVVGEHGATALLVHGHSGEYGALAYLTGFVPKLGSAVALVPKNGPIRILFSGGGGMLSSAKLLTWVEDVRVLNDLKGAIGDWLAQIRDCDEFVVGLWGDSTVAYGPYRDIGLSTRPFGKTINLDVPLDAVRRRKSSRESELLHRASGILTAAICAFRTSALEGSGARSAALAAERTAYAMGAQDFRALASARNGGPPLPFDTAADIYADPLLACLAVRFAGYWAEALVTVTKTPSGALARSEAALSAMLLHARAGASSADLAHVALQHLLPYRIHPLVETGIVSSIGLSLDESCGCAEDGSAVLEEGSVYTLRVGAAGEGGDHSIVSAMFAVNSEGIDVLWSAIDSPLDRGSSATL